MPFLNFGRVYCQEEELGRQREEMQRKHDEDMEKQKEEFRRHEEEVAKHKEELAKHNEVRLGNVPWQTLRQDNNHAANTSTKLTTPRSQIMRVMQQMIRAGRKPIFPTFYRIELYRPGCPGDDYRAFVLVA